MLWVIIAFLMACTVAALVITFGFLPADWGNADSIAATHRAIGWAIGLSAVLISGYALIPGMLLIAVAEGFRLRSVLFYGIAGGAAALLSFYGSSLGLHPSPQQALLDHDGEVIAASGIAAGLVYWALAGRNAGAWRERRVPARTLAADGSELDR